MIFPSFPLSHSIDGAVYTIARIHGSKNQDVEMGVTPLTIISSDNTSKNFVFCSRDYMFFWPRGLSSRERNASTRRHNNDAIELEVKTAFLPWGILMPLNQ